MNLAITETGQIENKINRFFKDWRLGTLLRQSNIKSVVAPILNLNQATNND